MVCGRGGLVLPFLGGGRVGGRVVVREGVKMVDLWLY